MYAGFPWYQFLAAIHKKCPRPISTGVPRRSCRRRSGCPLRTVQKTHHYGLSRQQLVSYQRDDRIQSQNRRRRARDGRCGPLALCLHAQMSTRFLKRHFDLPTTDEPCQYLLRSGVQVGTQECLRLQGAARIARQYSARRTTGEVALYRTAVPVENSTVLSASPYHRESVASCQSVVAQARVWVSGGCRVPFRGRWSPRVRCPRGAGSYRAASRPRRVTMHTVSHTAASGFSAAKLLSATTTIDLNRFGGQCLTISSN